MIYINKVKFINLYFYIIFFEILFFLYLKYKFNIIQDNGKCENNYFRRLGNI